MNILLSDIKFFLDSKEIEDLNNNENDVIKKYWENYFNKNQKLAIYIFIQVVKDLANELYNVDFDNQKQKVIEYKKNNIISKLYNPELKKYISLINEYFGKFKITSTTRYISGIPEHQNAIDITFINSDDALFLFEIFSYLYNNGRHRYNLDYWLGIAYPNNIHLHLEINTKRGYDFIEYWTGKYTQSKSKLTRLIKSIDYNFNDELNKVELYFRKISFGKYYKIFELIKELENKENQKILLPALFSIGGFIITEDNDKKIQNTFYSAGLGLFFYFLTTREIKNQLKQEIEKYQQDKTFWDKIKDYLDINKLLRIIE